MKGVYDWLRLDAHMTCQRQGRLWVRQIVSNFLKSRAGDMTNALAKDLKQSQARAKTSSKSFLSYSRHVILFSRSSRRNLVERVEQKALLARHKRHAGKANESIESNKLSRTGRLEGFAGASQETRRPCFVVD